MAESKVLTLRLDSALTEKLDRLADAMQRNRSFLVSEAIREYISLNEWQIEEIQKALREADAGDFASEADVKRSMKKWKRRAG